MAKGGISELLQYIRSQNMLLIDELDTASVYDPENKTGTFNVLVMAPKGYENAMYAVYHKARCPGRGHCDLHDDDYCRYSGRKEYCEIMEWHDLSAAQKVFNKIVLENHEIMGGHGATVMYLHSVVIPKIVFERELERARIRGLNDAKVGDK
jgi:predicted Fe-S protein YdhL (DUF1289 family)